MTQKWYATLPHPKMHPHTKFGIPTSKNIGDMHRTRSGTDGQCDYYMPPKVPLGDPYIVLEHETLVLIATASSQGFDVQAYQSLCYLHTHNMKEASWMMKAQTKFRNVMSATITVHLQDLFK